MQTPLSSRNGRARGAVDAKAARLQTSWARSEPGADDAAVRGDTARERELRCVPSVRRRIVERAIRLVGDTRYPSSFVIESVSLLLAGEILASARRN